MMKLKMLVAAAAIAGLPAMGHAQNMSKDSMMMKHDTTMMKGPMSGMKKSTKKATGMMKTEAAKEGESAAMEKNEMKMAAKHRASHAEKMENDAMKTPPADGTSCPMKCPTSKGAAALTGPQFLALQQELRDRGCGNQHVTGWLDAPTRHAIATCAKKMNVANSASAVLVAMNIGYSDADVSAAKMEE